MLAVMFLVLPAISSARADTRILARAGAWQAFGGTTSNGVPVCGVSQSTADGSYFGLKIVSRSAPVVVQLGHAGWQLADRQKVAIFLRFDASPPWSTGGAGMHFNEGDPGLEIGFTKADFDRFQLGFRTASQLRVQPENMPEWLVDLAGSSAISDALQECTRSLR